MPPEDVSYDVEELSARVKELERRLSHLEHPRASALCSSGVAPRLRPLPILVQAEHCPLSRSRACFRFSAGRYLELQAPMFSAPPRSPELFLPGLQ